MGHLRGGGGRKEGKRAMVKEERGREGQENTEEGTM